MSYLKIDSHKLIYHVARVEKWLRGENIYPIYVEISPSGACNHRCNFCAFDYLNYRPQFLVTDVLKAVLSSLAQHGVKSIMYAGVGEPLLHKDMAEIILHTKEVGMDVAVATNGVFFDDKVARECLSSLTWVRVSLNAGTKETYTKIHRSRPGDFDLVMKNLVDMVRIKKERGYACTIGVQMILLPQNYQEVVSLATMLKDIGVDYLTVKPFIKHPMSSNIIDEDFNYKDLMYLKDQLQNFSGNGLEIAFRAHSMEKLEKQDRPYERCLALPFFAKIDADGKVYTCGPFLGNGNFCYGNIYENSFSEIWEGERRQHILHKVEKELDVKHCMYNCRLDEINRYLWELKHPSSHVNFI